MFQTVPSVSLWGGVSDQFLIILSLFEADHPVRLITEKTKNKTKRKTKKTFSWLFSTFFHISSLWILTYWDFDRLAAISWWHHDMVAHHRTTCHHQWLINSPQAPQTRRDGDLCFWSTSCLCLYFKCQWWVTLIFCLLLSWRSCWPHSLVAGDLRLDDTHLSSL